MRKAVISTANFFTLLPHRPLVWAELVHKQCSAISIQKVGSKSVATVPFSKKLKELAGRGKVRWTRAAALDAPSDDSLTKTLYPFPVLIYFDPKTQSLPSQISSAKPASVLTSSYLDKSKPRCCPTLNQAQFFQSK